MMRFGAILILMGVMGSVMMLHAQDFDATATAIVAGATQTALAESNQPDGEATQDPFVLTATALVRAATQTAEAFTGETAVPITANAQSDDSFALTATALVEAATLQATSTEATVGDDNANALSATFFIFGGLLVALLVLGVIVVTVGRRGTGKRG
jgi:hypothetical protein